MKADDVSSSLLIPGPSVYADHAKQATVSSSIGSDEKNTSDENVNNDLASGTNVQGDNSTSGTFTDFNHQGSFPVDEPLLKADKNGTISVQGCSHEEDRVGSIDNEKIVDVNDVACKLDVPLDVTTFSNNKDNVNCEFFYEINAVKCMKSGTSDFVSQDGNAGCSETIPCGNEQSCVFKSNGYDELPERYVEDPGKQIGFESGMLPPNFEGKRCVADRLEDVIISYGNPFENDKWLINSGNFDAETEDILTSFKLHCSSEGFSVVSSQTELKHPFLNSMNRINGLEIDPNVKVTKDDTDDHAPLNEDVVTSFALETSSSNEHSFNCKIDNNRSFEKKLVTRNGDEPPSAFDGNSNMASSSTLETLKAVEAGCKNPQLDIMSCDNDAAVGAYSTTGIIQGRSQGCVSDPLSSHIPNKFEKQGHDCVNNADKFCITKIAEGEQVEICENDEAFLSFSRNQVESGVGVTSGAWNNV